MTKLIGLLKRYIGDKAFYREMLFVAFPIALQQLISAMVNLLDSAMIGRWGNMVLGAGGSEITSAAVLIANRYTSTIDNIMVMLAISCTIFIAQYFGAKNYKATKRVFGLAMKLTVSFGFLTAALGLIFRKQIIFFFSTGVGSGNEMMLYGEQYLSIIALTFIPYSISVAISFCLRAVKKTTIPLMAAGTAAVGNFVLNMVFIYGLNLGLYGAAIATVISRLMELGILLYYYYKHKPVFFGTLAETFKFPPGFASNILKRGWPMVLAQALTEGMAVFMFFAFARIDSGNASNIAAINLSSRVVEVVVAFVGGMGTAAAIMVGSRLGAGKIDEAKRNARWQIGYIVLISLVTIIIMISMIPFVQFVYDFDSQTNTLLAIVMTIHALSLPFLFYSSNVIFITRAGGFTKAPVLITNIPYLFIKIPLVAFFVFIAPDAFNNSPFLTGAFSAIGLPSDLIIFIFVIDRLIEVIRAIIGFIVIRKAPWQIDLTAKSMKEIQKVVIEPAIT